MKHRLVPIAALALLGLTGLSLEGTARAETVLRIGLADNPDIIDPTLSRTYSPRIVLNLMCDKLFDLTPDLKVVPQLAASHELSADGLTLTIKLKPGLTFQDGEKLDAAATKISLDRHLSMPGSFRKADLTEVKSIDVVDDLTIAISLLRPSAALLSTLSDRPGMIMSPKAAALGDKFITAPTCSGPYKFVKSVAQDQIVLERYAGYPQAADYHFDRVIFTPIADGTVRAANLRAGQLDMVERVSPADLTLLKQDPHITLANAPALGFDMLTFNLENGPRSKKPLGQDPRVREAFDAAIDRNVLNDVIFSGSYQAGNQFVSPTNYYYNKAIPVPPRDLPRAQALMKAAGLSHYPVTLLTANLPDWIQAGQILQAMTAEAGFDMKIEVQENATRSTLMRTGDFDVGLSFYGGRVDPDGNLQRLVCNDASNDAKYCNPELDNLSREANQVEDPAERKKRYDAASVIIARDRPIVYLWHRTVLYAYKDKLKGFVANPDGLIRLGGVTMAN